MAKVVIKNEEWRMMNEELRMNNAERNYAHRNKNLFSLQ